MLRPTSRILVLAALGCATSAPAPRAPSNDERLVQLVEQIRQADYAGDRQALRELHAALASEPTGSSPKSLVLYWRGFALWRRAINSKRKAVAGFPWGVNV